MPGAPSSDALAPSSFLLLVAMPFAPSSFVLLVVRPGAPSGVLCSLRKSLFQIV